MRVAVLTSLFPVPLRPNEGVFAKRRWEGMAARGHQIRIVHPLPLAPPRPLDWWLGHERRARVRAPSAERSGALEIVRPRYLHLPRASVGNARRFAKAGVGEVARSESSPEVVVLDYAWPAAMASRALCGAGYPVVVHGRGSDVLEVRDVESLRPHLSEGIRRAGHWCAVSRDLVGAMDVLAGAAGHGKLTPNGVDADLFKPGDRSAARARLLPECRGPLVLVVGHLIARKRPLAALQGFLDGCDPEAHLVFVGSGPLEQELRDAIAAHAVGQRVHLVGECRGEDLAGWYRAADLLVLASDREGRPNVVLEALASGLPVVATAAGGTPELMDRFPEQLVAPADGLALGRAIRSTLADPPDPELCRSAVAPYTWPAALDALEEQLRAAVESGR